jgi:hypothetical protein
MDWTAHLRAAADLEAEQEDVLRQFEDLNLDPEVAIPSVQGTRSSY